MDMYAEDFVFTYSDHRRIDEFLSALEEICFLSHLSENIKTYGLTDPVRHILDYDKTSSMILGSESLNNTEMTAEVALEGIGTFISNILKAIRDFFVWFFKLIGRVFFGYKESKEDSEEKFKKKKEERDYFKDKKTSSEDEEYSEAYWKKRQEEARKAREEAHRKADEANRQYEEERKRRAEETKRQSDEARRKADEEKRRQEEKDEEERVKRKQEEARRAEERAKNARDYTQKKIIKYKGARFRMAKVVAIDDFLQKLCSTKFESLEAFLNELKKIPNIDIFSDKCNYTVWVDMNGATPHCRTIGLDDDEEMKLVDIKDSGWDAQKIGDIDQYFYQVFSELQKDGRMKTMFRVGEEEEHELKSQAEKLEKLGDDASKEELEKVKKKLQDVIHINKTKAALVAGHSAAISRVIMRTNDAIHTLKVLYSYSRM